MQCLWIPKIITTICTNIRQCFLNILLLLYLWWQCFFCLLVVLVLYTHSAKESSSKLEPRLESRVFLMISNRTTLQVHFEKISTHKSSSKPTIFHLQDEWIECLNFYNLWMDWNIFSGPHFLLIFIHFSKLHVEIPCSDEYSLVQSVYITRTTRQQENIVMKNIMKSTIIKEYSIKLKLKWLLIYFKPSTLSLQ